MIDFPELLEIPLAKWVDGIMSWLLTNLDGFFDAIGYVILQVVLAFEKFFIFIPWFVMIPLVGIAGWKLVKSWKLGIAFMVMLLMIGSFGYW